MATVDYLILGCYLIATLALGTWFSRGQRSLSDFFLAGRNIPWWAAAFSGIATILSAVSFLGAPGQAFKSDLRFLQYRLGVPFALFIIGWIMIPFFYKLRVFSIYEYLEARFDLKTRLLAGGQFFLLKTLYLAISIYAPALLFVQLTGWPVSVMVCAVGLFVTLYTTLGGVKAVIWTDTLQLFILFAGLATAAVTIASKAGGAGDVLRMANAQDKLRFVDWSPSLISEYTFWGGLLGGTFVLISQYGVNQAELQKMLTTESVAKSRLALISSMIVASLVGLVYFLIGAGLFVFYTQNPQSGAFELNPDRVFAKFIIEELPPGIKGLLLAAVAAAAMSASSSVLNSLSTVATTDFYGRLVSRQPSVSAARVMTAVLGIGCTLGALYVDRLGNLLVSSTKLQNFFGGSLTGAFLLGMMTRRTNGWGAFLGTLTGTAAVAGLSAWTEVSWLWHGLFAAVVSCASGALFSRFFTPPNDSIESLTLRARRPASDGIRSTIGTATGKGAGQEVST